MTDEEQKAAAELDKILAQDGAMKQVENLYICKLAQRPDSAPQWETTNILLFKALTSLDLKTRSEALSELVSFLLQQHLVELSAHSFGAPQSKCYDEIEANNSLIEYLNKANAFHQSLRSSPHIPQNLR